MGLWEVLVAAVQRGDGVEANQAHQNQVAAREKKQGQHRGRVTVFRVEKKVEEMDCVSKAVCTILLSSAGFCSVLKVNIILLTRCGGPVSVCVLPLPV